MTFSCLGKPAELMAASELSDGQLYTLCCDYGRKVLPNRTLETLVRDEKSLHVQRAPLQLSESVKSRLEELQEKGLDVNALLTEFLDHREAELERKKEDLVEAGGTRYIPVAVRRMLREEHGSKCSIPGCTKTAQEIHHTRRFSISRSHDPHYLAPLCREHHQLAHWADQGYREMSASRK